MDDSITWQQLAEQTIDEAQLMLGYHGYSVLEPPRLQFFGDTIAMVGSPGHPMLDADVD
jgi:hypothetical protein